MNSFCWVLPLQGDPHTRLPFALEFLGCIQGKTQGIWPFKAYLKFMTPQLLYFPWFLIILSSQRPQRDFAGPVLSWSLWCIFASELGAISAVGLWGSCKNFPQLSSFPEILLCSRHLQGSEISLGDSLRRGSQEVPGNGLRRAGSIQQLQEKMGTFSFDVFGCRTSNFIFGIITEAKHVLTGA